MKKGERRKQELIRIAYRSFITRGYENTSVDDIIDEAGIAKGTYYYYFESKEQTLEEVIEMMVDQEAEAAKRVADSDIPTEQKIAGVIAAFQPAQNEAQIEGALMRPENTVMHTKVKKRLVEAAVPVLSEVIGEGVRNGIFSCDDIPQRVRMLLVISNDLFDEGSFEERDIEVFIDVTEKLLGAKPGTMGFLRKLVSQK